MFPILFISRQYFIKNIDKKSFSSDISLQETENRLKSIVCFEINLSNIQDFGNGRKILFASVLEAVLSIYP